MIFSLETSRVLPNHAFYYKDVAKVDKTGEHQVTFTVKGNRGAAIGGDLRLPTLPKGWAPTGGPAVSSP